MRSREKKEADELRMFELKQQKKREKQGDISPLGFCSNLIFETEKSEFYGVSVDYRL